MYQTSRCPGTHSQLPIPGPGQQKMVQFPPAQVRPELPRLPPEPGSLRNTQQLLAPTTDGPELLQGPATGPHCCGHAVGGVAKGCGPAAPLAPKPGP